MKPAIPIAAAFVVGLAGGTFVGKGHAAPPAVAAPAPKGAAAPAAADTAVAAPVDKPAPDSVPAAEQGVVVADSNPAAPKSDATQLAAVFAKLAPADIVPLVTHISDDDLVPVLRKLPVATTASVLALLPKERSAALSKRLLVPTGTGKP